MKRPTGLPDDKAPIDLTNTIKRTDIITVTSTHNHQVVKIRKFHSPICIRLWQLAGVHMINNQADLLNDSVDLSRSSPGDKFLWAWSVNGTMLLKLNGANWESLYEVAREYPVGNFHILEVKEIENYHAAGYITWINVRMQSQLKRAIRENVK